MSLHDLFTQAGRDRARRRCGCAWPGADSACPACRGLRRRGPGCSARATARGRRRLAAIDRALATETPRLASMFAMFNQLAAEEPVGAERLPSRAWPRPGLAQCRLLRHPGRHRGAVRRAEHPGAQRDAAVPGLRVRVRAVDRVAPVRVAVRVAVRVIVRVAGRRAGQRGVRAGRVRAGARPELSGVRYS